jgi:hypothetical protein
MNNLKSDKLDNFPIFDKDWKINAHGITYLSNFASDDIYLNNFKTFDNYLTIMQDNLINTIGEFIVFKCYQNKPKETLEDFEFKLDFKQIEFKIFDTEVINGLIFSKGKLTIISLNNEEIDAKELDILRLLSLYNGLLSIADIKEIDDFTTCYCKENGIPTIKTKLI